MTPHSDDTVSPVSADSNVVNFGRNVEEPQKSSVPGEMDAPPANRTKRSRGARNKLVVFFNFLITSTLLAVIATGAALYYGKQVFDRPGPLTNPTTALISKGAGLDRIADVLESQGVIDQPFVFKMGVQASRAQRQLKAGEYSFTPGMSLRDVMNTLTSGKAILHAFTAPEGLTSIQIMRRLASDPILQGELPPVPQEGTMLPETYRFQRGTDREKIVANMIEAQKKALEEIWNARNPDIPLSTPEELVTLASIVEKETGVASERPLVASIFINRLNKGMKLQSDPTIIYGIFGGQGKPKDRPIYRSDIQKPTAYNTYTIPALPPGPIANPGRASMEAVANPAESDYLFFVADGTGGHVFAKTLKEHEANVVKWRAIEKQRAAEAKAASGNGTSN